jgi:CBS domain-containing protein
MFEALHNKNKYPTMKKEFRLPWQCFTTPYLGVDREVDKEIIEILDNNLDKKIDFRPYMNETPVICNTCDAFKVVLETFRKMNLRHMPVLDSKNGKLSGMITRQDLFRWLDI